MLSPGGKRIFVGAGAFDQAVELVGGIDLFQRQRVEKRRQRVGQIERQLARRRTAIEAVIVLSDQPRQLEPAPERRQRRRQVEAQSIQIERRLAFVEITDGADLRQQHRLAARLVGKGLRHQARAAPRRRQDCG